MAAAGQDQALHRRFAVIVRLQCEVKVGLQSGIRFLRAAPARRQRDTAKYRKNPGRLHEANLEK
jgi:hypothetical protein